MAHLLSTIGLYDALKAEGFQLPDHCVDVQLITPRDGAFALRYEVFVTDDDLEKLGHALARIAEESRKRHA